MASGILYVIGDATTSVVKIGCTRRSVHARLAQLQTGHPAQLDIKMTFDVAVDLRAVEQEVHSLLASHRQQGEWFALPMSLAALETLIQSIIAAQQTLPAPLPDAEYDPLSQPGPNTLHALLKEYQVSLLKVSEGTGIDYASLHSWATNKRPMIPYRPLILLCLYFEVSPTRIQPWLGDVLPKHLQKPSILKTGTHQEGV
jgi:hypothetical protein